MSDMSPARHLGVVNADSAMLRLSNEFAALASGHIQVPKTSPIDLLSSELSPERRAFCEYLWLNSGPLFKHFLTSVPAILEELSRIGCSILRMCERSKSDRKFYWELDAFDGTFARALAHFSSHQIATFTNTPNIGNVEHFKAFSAGLPSRLVACPFYDLDEHIIARELEPFGFNIKRGFDFAFEMAAFQFYNHQREQHVSFTRSFLAHDSLAFFLEKVTHPCEAEYWRRERIKDSKFKAIYFSDEEIQWKQRQMLKMMQDGQVTIEDLRTAVKQHFGCCHTIWNSGNFYIVGGASSDAGWATFLENIERIVIDDIFIDFCELSFPQ